MKKTLFIIAMVIGCSSCFGQKKDSIKSKWVNATGVNYRVQNGDTIWYNPKTGAQISKFGEAASTAQSNLSLWATPTHTGRNEFTITQKQDTVKVLLLVSDTSMSNSFGKRVTVTDSVWRFERRWSEGVWWQFGYEVVPENWDTMIMNRYGMVIYPEPLYLDQNKKPLPSNVVVWMSKEIK